jgi:hypothetical protein
VAVLDELTTALDPYARRATWELVRGVRAEGVTVVLVNTSTRFRCWQGTDQTCRGKNSQGSAHDAPPGEDVPRGDFAAGPPFTYQTVSEVRWSRAGALLLAGDRRQKTLCPLFAGLAEDL